MFDLDIDSLLENKEVDNKAVDTELGVISDLERWTELFKDYLKNQNKSENTFHSYLFTLNGLKMFLEEDQSSIKKLSEINDKVLNSFLAWMENYKLNSYQGSLKERLSWLDKYIKELFRLECHKVEGNEKDYLMLDAKQNIIESVGDLDGTDFDRLNFAIDSFIDFIDERELPLSELNNAVLKEYIDKVNNTYWKTSNKTMQQRRAVITSFLSFLEEKNTEDKKFKHLFKYLNKYKVATKTTHDRKPFEADEAIKIFDFLNSYIYDYPSYLSRVRATSEYIAYRNTFLVLMMMFGGCRTSETLNLKYSDFKLDDSGDLYIVSLTGKGNKIRNTYIPKKIIYNHLTYLEENKKGEYIASTNKGRVNRHNLYNEINSLFVKMGLEDKKGLHIFRHHFASTFAEKDGNIVILQKIMGHAKIDTTMIYAKVGEEVAKDSIRGMAKDNSNV